MIHGDVKNGFFSVPYGSFERYNSKKCYINYIPDKQDE